MLINPYIFLTGEGAQSYQDVISADAPVRYLRLEEASGTSIADYMGGTAWSISGTHTLGVTGAVDNGIEFDGASLSLGESMTPTAMGFSIEFWIKLKTSESSSNAYIVSRANTFDVIFHFGGANTITVFRNFSPTLASSTLPITVPRDDAWHHYVVTHDGTTIRGYLDGSEVTTHAQTASYALNTAVRVARDTTGGNPFIGCLDEIAWYDYVLTPYQILQHYHAGLGQTLWTPAEITTALWLDADDASTFTLTGADIDEWRDKSGNARHATPPTATKPTRNASLLNSMGGVVFASGTDPLLTTSFANPTGADGLMVAMVVRRTGVPVNYSTPFTKGATNTQWSLVWGSSSLLVSQGRNASFWRNNTTSGNTAGGPTDQLVTGTDYLWSGSMGNAHIKQFFDGTELSGSQGSATRNFGAASALTVGSGPDSGYSSNRLQGHIHEIVVVYADMTDATRQKIEGYLAWKWGLEANLPAGHPYKDAAPTIDGDPYWPNVSSLLHMDGADASTTFTDVKGKTWTPSGNAQIDTAQFKFGGSSCLLDGSGDYLTTPSSADFAYGTDDFTWELWFRPASIAGVQYIIEHGTNGGSLIHNTFLRYYNTTTGVGSALYTTGSALTVGAWQHIAVAREAGTTRVFVDGVLMMSGADSHNYGSQQLRIGSYGSPSSYANGWIDDFRITKGVARYTSNFTPPSKQLPNG